eukprot:11867282-Alexandrium_andersonii.AAC.1
MSGAKGPGTCGNGWAGVGACPGPCSKAAPATGAAGSGGPFERASWARGRAWACPLGSAGAPWCAGAALAGGQGKGGATWPAPGLTT